MSESVHETTKIRPHVVLNRIDGDPEKTHALTWSDGDFAGIIFTYNSIKFVEDNENDKLIVKFDYTAHEVPEHLVGYDKKKFEAELGDFIMELLNYGLAQNMLGYVNFKYEDVLNMPAPIDSGFTEK